MAEKEIMVELDSRNRICLTKVKNRHDRYRILEEPNGTLILTPVDLLTKDEQAYLANPELRAAVEHSQAHPEERRPWVRRTPRKSEVGE
jgi:hypothetical protein